MVPGLRLVNADKRLHALRPLKLLPRRLGSLSDRLQLHQVLYVTRRLGFTRPTLWLNDVTYAPLILRTGWPTVYDVTDDWLLAPLPPREIARLRTLDEIALTQAYEVVVCSPTLAASRGTRRAVTLVANGVDVDHFRLPRPRPTDLPPAPTAVYLGTLHDARLDIELVIELAQALSTISIVLVGPDALESVSRRRLTSEPNIHLLGPHRYADVPGYLQHADVVVVPHRITPFTESLDPIKAYECLAVDTPVVATPVAGFRELAGAVRVVPREAFIDGVRAALAAGGPGPARSSIPTWNDRAAVFEEILSRAGARSGLHTRQ
jgi:glycosyltransferase involved in cell wall biosynthesis